MTSKLIFILIFFAVLTSCENVRQNNQVSESDSDTTNQISLATNSSNKFETIEINCDSIYKNNQITIKLIPVDSIINNKPVYNFIFLVIQQQSEQQAEIYRDTVESRVQEVKFADFNNDKVKDILIQNFSDVRSNWTYNLYIVNKDVKSIKKIKGFEEIKNPNYLPKYDLIDNKVMSGRNWTSFYRIQGDSIKNYNIVIYDGVDVDGKSTYNTDYKKALNKIMAN